MSKWLALALLAGLALSCAPKAKVKPAPAFFYVTPEVTYLKDSPGPGNIMGPLYRGDKVERVDSGEGVWMQVKLLRSGQTGWTPKEMLSAEPVATVFYYVNEDSLPLRECPRSDCLPIQQLYRAEPVQRVEQGEQGWWRVLSLKSRTVGWVVAAALTERLEEAQQARARKPYLYVAVARLNLRAQPFGRGEVIRTLKFNDQVEKISEAQGWLKVRQPASGAVGWVNPRDLQPLPLAFPRGAAPAKEEEPKPFKQREEPQSEPEFM